MKTHCINCGQTHSEISFPKKCASCGNEMYKNPVPVAVVLIPVKNKGLLLILRGNGIGQGKWALPGGFVDNQESPYEAGVREVREEVQVDLKSPLKLLGIEMSSNKQNMLVFMQAEEILESDVHFQQSKEVRDIQYVKYDFPEISFLTHEKYIKDFCKKHYGEKNDYSKRNLFYSIFWKLCSGLKRLLSKK